MGRRRYLVSLLLSFVLSVLVIDLIAFAVVGLICWFGGWRSLESYANGLVYAGAVIFFFGVLGGPVNVKIPGILVHQSQVHVSFGSELPGDATRPDRAADRRARSSFALTMIVAAIISAALGMALYTILQ